MQRVIEVILIFLSLTAILEVARRWLILFLVRRRAHDPDPDPDPTADAGAPMTNGPTTLPGFMRGCYFAVNRPGVVEVCLFRTADEARAQRKPGDMTIPSRDGSCWLIRATPS